LSDELYVGPAMITMPDGTAVILMEVVYNGDPVVGELLVDLFPRFADIQIKKLTRSTSNWRGAYKKLLTETPSQLPW
jgi:hypothetical protein